MTPSKPACEPLRAAAILLAAMLSGCGIAVDAVLGTEEEEEDPGPQPPVVAFQANPTTLNTGDTVTLAWSSGRADSCQASGSWSGALPLVGTESPKVYTPGTYVLTVSCIGPGGLASANVQLTVQGAALDVVELTADPASIAVGQSTTLTWSTNVTNFCSATGGWTGNRNGSGSASATVSAAGVNTFGLTCFPRIGQVQAEVTVNGLQSTATIDASKLTVGAGQTTVLTWSSTQAGGCTASGAWSGSKAASGSEEVTAPPSAGNHAYNLTCANPGAAATDSVTVTAVGATLSFRAFPSKVNVGEPVTLSWESPYALGCVASGGWSGARPISGSETFIAQAAGAVTYSMFCSNPENFVTAIREVTTTAVPALPPATAYQMNPRHDGSTTFANFTLPALATPAWSRDLGELVQYPLIADGRVIVMTEELGGSNGTLYALDPATGATLWGPISVSGFVVGHTYANGRIFVQTDGGMVRTFNATNGWPLWNTQVPGSIYDSAPTALGGYVFATGNSFGLHALMEENGAIAWSNLMSGASSSPAVTSEGVFTMRTCEVGAFNPATGAQTWRRQLGCSSGGGRTMAVRETRLFARRFASFSDDGVIMDAATGEDAGDMASQTIPAVTDTRFFTLNAGTLAGWQRSDNSQSWTFTGDGTLVSAPIVVNDTVFVGSTLGIVFAVNAATGTQQWFGTAPAGIEAPDEANFGRLTGLAAGEGWLVVPAGNTVSAWSLQ